MTDQTNNPYAAAAGAYGQNAQKNAPDERDLEARVLLKSAKRLEDIKNNWDNTKHAELDEALRYNRQIWLMFVDTAIEDNDPARPASLRNNIASLGVFIFKHSKDLLTAPEMNKLDILIEINREIAAGLMTKPKQPSENGDKSATTSTK